MCRRGCASSASARRSPAIVLAEAGLRRLGYALDLERGTLKSDGGEWHASSLAGRIIPAIGQGAIALADSRGPRGCAGRSRTDQSPADDARDPRRARRCSGCSRATARCRSEFARNCATASSTCAASFFPNPASRPRRARCLGIRRQPEALAAELFRQLTGAVSCADASLHLPGGRCVRQFPRMPATKVKPNGNLLSRRSRAGRSRAGDAAGEGGRGDGGGDRL